MTSETELRALVLDKAEEAKKLAGDRTGYARKAHIRKQWEVIVHKYPGLSSFRDLYLRLAGAVA